MAPTAQRGSQLDFAFAELSVQRAECAKEVSVE